MLYGIIGRLESDIARTILFASPLKYFAELLWKDAENFIRYEK